MKITIKDGLDTWELTTTEDTELNKEIESHANALIEIAKNVLFKRPHVKPEINISIKGE